MKADNTKKKEYIEPQIEYIAFFYADVVADSEEDPIETGADTGDDTDDWV